MILVDLFEDNNKKPLGAAQDLNEFAPSPDFDGGGDSGFPRRPQKFNKGDVVWVAKDLGSTMSHFNNDCPAIVMYSYESEYGGGVVYVDVDLNDPDLSAEDRKYWINDAREQANQPHDYGLFVLSKDYVGETAWYPENVLTRVPPGTDPVALCSQGNAEPYAKLPAQAKKLLAQKLGSPGVAEGFMDFIGLGKSNPESPFSNEKDIQQSAMPVYQDLIKRIAQDGGIGKQRTNGLASTAERLLQQIYRYQKVQLTKQNYAELVTNRIKADVAQAMGQTGVAEGIFDRFKRKPKKLTPLPTDGSVIKVLGRDVKIEYDGPHTIWFIWQDKNGKEQGESFNTRYDNDTWEYDAYGPPSLEALTKMIAGEIEYQDNPPPPSAEVLALIRQQREKDPRLDRIMRDQEARNPSFNDQRTNQILNLKNMPASSTVHEQDMAEAHSPEEFVKNIKNVAKKKTKFQVGDWVTIDPNETAGWATSGMMGKIVDLTGDGRATINVNPGGGARGVQRRLSGIDADFNIRSSGTHTVVPVKMLELLPVSLDEQGVAEGLAEARNSLFAFVKQQFPTWPDYVLKDFLYAQAKGIRDQAELDDFLKRNKQDFGNCKWTLTKLPITFDIFTPKTQRMLASREGGSSNPFQVPRDAERHAQQSQMIQQKGVSAEPIIVAKLSNGYDLIEGWHRTIQHLKAFPQGYTGPAWICTGATYTSESVEQGVAETSPERAEKYILDVTKQQTKKLGSVKPDMYGRIEQTFGAKGPQRKKGVDRALNRLHGKNNLAEVTGDLKFDTMLSKLVSSGKLQTIAKQLADVVRQFPQYKENDKNAEYAVANFPEMFPNGYPGGRFFGSDGGAYKEILQTWKQIGPSAFSEEDENFNDDSFPNVIGISEDYTDYWTRLNPIVKSLKAFPDAWPTVLKMVWHELFGGGVAQGTDNINRQDVAETSNEKIANYRKKADPDMSAALKSGDINRANKRLKGIRATQRRSPDSRIDYLDGEQGVAESASPDEYYIWTVHFVNPEKNPPRRVRVYSDEFVEELERITKFYAKKGLTVADVDTDVGIRSEPKTKPEPYEPGSGHKRLDGYGKPVGDVTEGSQSFHNGMQVQLIKDYADPSNPEEVFTVSHCDRERGRCWIGDEQGRGWYATFDQLIPVDDDEDMFENTPKMSARDKLQQAVDREKKQAQQDRTGLAGMDYDQVQRQLRGIQDRTRPKKVDEDQDAEGVERAILHRIMVGHKDLLLKYGPQQVMQAAEQVAYDVGDLDEIGTSDVSGWVQRVQQILGAVSEAKATSTRLDPKCWTGKKIGTPKTKVKNGVRVNNCVPK
jgi:hypothetical protein